MSTLSCLPSLSILLSVLQLFRVPYPGCPACSSDSPNPQALLSFFLIPLWRGIDPNPVACAAGIDARSFSLPDALRYATVRLVA